MSRRKSTLGGVNIHRDAPGTKPSRSENLKRIAVARRRSGLLRDLIATKAPMVARLDAVNEIKALARAVYAGRLSLPEARAQLRGAA